MRLPVQLIIRGARSRRIEKPNLRYSRTMRGVAWFESTTGPAMAREELGQAHLLVPAEALPGILRELDVVGRVGVDEIARLELQRLEIAGR